MHFGDNISKTLGNDMLEALGVIFVFFGLYVLYQAFVNDLGVSHWNHGYILIIFGNLIYHIAKEE